MVGQNRKTDEEHDEVVLKKGFSWPGQNLTEMVRETGRKVLIMVNCNINILAGLELEVARSKKSSSYFENNFPILLFYLCLMFHIE